MGQEIIIFITGLVVGCIVLWVWVGASKKDGLKGFNVEREKKTQENKQKILEFLQNKDRVANNDIQNLLSVSDATATRYLEELEKEGKIKQVGKTGRFTYYQKA